MESLQLTTLRNLERNASTAIARVIASDQSDAGKGAMFRLYHLTTREDSIRGLSELWAGWIGGRVNSAKRQAYGLFATEKALRLAKNCAESSHRTSFESARPDNQEYAGAVLLRARIPDIDQHSASFIIATVSGLSAINDQRTALLTIELMQWHLGDSIDQVLAVIQDPEYLHVRDILPRRDGRIPL